MVVLDRSKQAADATSTLARHGIEEKWIIPCPVTRQAGYQAVVNLLEEPEPPTAAVAYSDRVAFGIMAAAHGRGLKVGEDIALVGFDDLEQAELSRPALATIATQSQTVGREAALALIARMRKHDSQRTEHLVPSRLIVRDSSGASVSIEGLDGDS